MPSRLDRVLRIVILLQSGLSYNAIQLAEATGVHRRTIFRDIASLRALGLPVEFDPATGRYYLLREAPLGAHTLSVDELAELLLAAALESCGSETVRYSIEKLVLRIPPECRQRILEVNRAAAVSSGKVAPDLLVMERIQFAMQVRASLAIVVDPPGHRKEKLVVVPHSLRISADDSWLSATVAGDSTEREIRIGDIRRAALADDDPKSPTLVTPHILSIQRQDRAR